ncbi:uncharacterized protein AMSG_11612 [Thecamonas trahens ATCC 50062]|uniref:Uncharacterized protein n=1 Tax=Thecamonas trahens ATCC 50062 TaxID=461836 RepID=A0A0L0DDY5_THETB|nr:hypothetical protein AMSG_11612 [Thecamonas trahens ATCC 50062]KNC50547.1 hypothetical protein AMSG_11612 [Thecamonas trahens ATCC 50062]|eukprot:XP_013762591.1 hypothetical protein AMSG_11612 [Thecamonas trahens ATCC 50062]
MHLISADNDFAGYRAAVCETPENELRPWVRRAGRTWCLLSSSSLLTSGGCLNVSASARPHNGSAPHTPRAGNGFCSLRRCLRRTLQRTRHVSHASMLMQQQNRSAGWQAGCSTRRSSGG